MIKTNNPIYQGWLDCLNAWYAWIALLSIHCEQYPEIYSLLFWVQLTPRWRYQQTPIFMTQPTIISATCVAYWTIETDQDDWPNYQGNPGYWDRVMGESLEPVTDAAEITGLDHALSQYLAKASSPSVEVMIAEFEFGSWSYGLWSDQVHESRHKEDVIAWAKPAIALQWKTGLPPEDGQYLIQLKRTPIS